MNLFEKTEGRVRMAALAAVLLGLMLPAVALTAPADTYQNDSVVDKTIPPDSMPVIDATNFINNNSFSITFTDPRAFTQRGGQASVETFEAEDTLNYTNTGLMVANSSYLTNTFGVPLAVAPGCGFLFDRYSTTTHLQTMAGSFINAGTIRANSLVDILASASFLSTIGKCTVNASNIVNSGTMQLGFNSLIQFTGENVDLTQGLLGIEGFGTVSGVDWGVGVDTNLDWIPSIELTAGTALSSFFTTAFLGPFRQMFLSNSTPYFQITAGVSNVTVRAIFLQNQLTNNVSAKVFWANSPFFSPGGGFFNIEWDGTYYDPSTGLLTTNYLYLNASADFATTNVGGVFNGIPANFTFFAFNQELFFIPPATPGYPAGIFQPFGATVTNIYSYVNAKFIDTTASTNATIINPNGALTNLPGRIQISASRNMDLTLAQISGLNYMSLTCTNQFNGAAGAQIFSPFSDINLGVTNGFLSISNVLEPVLVDWKGGVEAWATHWIYVDPFGVTNDYRIILVNSALSPTAPSEIQNLTLHGTNLVISDALNTFGTVSIDARNLTLTTNIDTPGAPDGELIIRNPNTVWGTALPNIRNLTNSGLISVLNANPVNFGSAASPYNAFINHGRVYDQGSTIYAANFESDGVISNSVLGSFILKSQNTTLTNGTLYAGGDVSITTGSLLTSNLFLWAARSLTLTVTNLLDDTGPTNGNIWVVGTNSNGGVGSGFNLLRLPAVGDLLGTTVTNYAPASKTVVNIWAGTNYGVSTLGFTNNNAAIGRLILDALPGPNNPLNQNQNGVFTNKGVGANNAIYVDYLELRDAATNRDQNGTGTNFVALGFNTNLVIYYAQAVMSGVSVAKKIDHWNSGHLRWVPQYNGYFSSTNLVYPGNVTNSINAALAQDPPALDSDGDGIINSLDPTPVFEKSQVNCHSFTTNVTTRVIVWNSIPSATNTVFYSPNVNGLFTNALLLVSVTPTVYYVTNASPLAVSNFVSPSLVPPAGGWPITNTVYDSISPPGYYRVRVWPNNTDQYGPGF